MSKTIEVETTLGTFQLIKPKAGVRNRAIAKAETDSGGIKQTVLMMELLPKCVNKRPEGVDQDVPIDQVLDGMEIEDYDALFIALTSLLDLEQMSEEKKTK